jgi:hypothetical protein
MQLIHVTRRKCEMYYYNNNLQYIIYHAEKVYNFKINWILLLKIHYVKYIITIFFFMQLGNNLTININYLLIL